MALDMASETLRIYLKVFCAVAPWTLPRSAQTQDILCA